MEEIKVCGCEFFWINYRLIKRLIYCQPEKVNHGDYFTKYHASNHQITIRNNYLKNTACEHPL